MAGHASPVPLVALNINHQADPTRAIPLVKMKPLPTRPPGVAKPLAKGIPATQLKPMTNGPSPLVMDHEKDDIGVPMMFDRRPPKEAGFQDIGRTCYAFVYNFCRCQFVHTTSVLYLCCLGLLDICCSEAVCGRLQQQLRSVGWIVRDCVALPFVCVARLALLVFEAARSFATAFLRVPSCVALMFSEVYECADTGYWACWSSLCCVAYSGWTAMRYIACQPLKLILACVFRSWAPAEAIDTCVGLSEEPYDPLVLEQQASYRARKQRERRERYENLPTFFDLFVGCQQAFTSIALRCCVDFYTCRWVVDFYRRSGPVFGDDDDFV